MIKYILTFSLILSGCQEADAQTLSLKQCVNSCFVTHSAENKCEVKKPLVKHKKKVKKNKVKKPYEEPLCVINPVETFYVPALTEPTFKKGTLDPFTVHQTPVNPYVNITQSYAGISVPNFGQGPVPFLFTRQLPQAAELMATPLPASAFLFISGVIALFGRRYK